jgi:hypothetical protein
MQRPVQVRVRWHSDRTRDWKMYLDIARQTDRHVEQPVASDLEIRMTQSHPDAEVQRVQRQETDSFPPGPVGQNTIRISIDPDKDERRGG